MTAPDGRHLVVNPGHLAPPSGFAHAVVAAPGRQVFLGGQTALDARGRLVGGTVVEQFDRAAGNLMEALKACGGRAEDLVSMQVFTTDLAAYKRALRELAPVYRRHFGYHYPAMALLGVRELFDAEALVELMATAVIGDPGAGDPGAEAVTRSQ